MADTLAGASSSTLNEQVIVAGLLNRSGCGQVCYVMSADVKILHNLHNLNNQNSDAAVVTVHDLEQGA